VNAKKVSQGTVNKSVLDQYKEIYSMYHHATRLIKEDNLDSAELILQEIFNDHKDLQVPIEMYKTYILLLLTNKKEKQARQFLSNAPDEIKYAGEILQIQQKYQLVVPEKVQHQRNYMSKKMMYSLISILILCMLGIGLKKFDMLNRSEQASKDVNVLKEQIKDLEDKNKTMEMQVNAANKKLTEVSQSKKADQQEKQTEPETDKSNSLTPDTVVKEAVESYEKGFKHFQNKNYKQAIEQLKLSYTLDSTNYSSDDALYYLILSEQRMNKKTNVRPYITEFVNQKNEFFKKSPYYDDVILMQAKWFITDGKNKEAEKLLNEIVSKYKKEWTANTAARLLKSLNK